MEDCLGRTIVGVRMSNATSVPSREPDDVQKLTPLQATRAMVEYLRQQGMIPMGQNYSKAGLAIDDDGTFRIRLWEEQ